MKRHALTAALVVFCGATAVVGQEVGAPARPSQPTPASGPYSWAVGPFAYDPSGNVATIGGNYYVYDPMGRVVTASVQRPDQPGSQVITYGYDVYGNRTTVNSIATSAASLATNRLTSGGAIYDAAGNLVQWQPPNSALIRQYTYDSLDMITNEVTGGQAVANIYTADDERLWRYEVTKNVSHWSLRDAGGRVLREFVDDPLDDNGAAWKLFREYVYRDGQLLAVNTPADTWICCGRCHGGIPPKSERERPEPHECTSYGDADQISGHWRDRHPHVPGSEQPAQPGSCRLAARSGSERAGQGRFGVRSVV